MVSLFQALGAGTGRAPRWVALSVCLLTWGCTESKFSTVVRNKSASAKPRAVAETAAGIPVAREARSMPMGEGVADVTFRGDIPFQSAISEAEAWVVTEQQVTRIKLDESAGWPKTVWNMVDSTGAPSSSRGHRTYVSEIGLLIGRTNHSGGNGGVWLASDKNPGKAVPIYIPSDQDQGSRLSVTSFRIGQQPYIGLAYGTSSGNKKFVRIPIDKSKSSGIDVSRKEEVTFGPLSQGVGGFEEVGSFAAYGSYMDQTRKALFLGANKGGGMWGVNVETLRELSSDVIPNVTLEGRNVCDIKMSTRSNIAYALAGDLQGNIVTSSEAYTFAHEPLHNVILGTLYGRIILAKQECIVANASECTQASLKCAVFQPSNVGSIGPMSAVGDGRVVGIMRGESSSNPTQVFVMSLLDKADFSKGLKFTKAADVPGDAYMYNDFTGLTLYAPEQTKVIDFKKLGGFKPGQAVKTIAVGWSTAAKNITSLRGLKIELVCFKEGGSKGPYIDYTKHLTTSGSLFTVASKDCSGDVDSMQIKVSSDGTTNDFTRFVLFELRGAQ